MGKDKEPFHAGRASFEYFNFQLATPHVQDKASVELTCSIYSTHGRFCLFTPAKLHIPLGSNRMTTLIGVINLFTFSPQQQTELIRGMSHWY